jgi:N-acetylglucosaminyldiphosphoundecaprenol N-acetyl-beta-D-mannosaminyltransferase
MILGVRYFNGPVEELVKLSHEGGLIVVPSGPGLAEIDKHADYRSSLENARFAIIDSSFLVLLWLIRKGEPLIKVSGLQFLKALIKDTAFREKGATFWIMPSEEDLFANIQWLNSNGFCLKRDESYVAPRYEKGRIADEILVAALEKTKPKFVMINIGGGTQEVLGAFLQSRLSFRPAFICTGAAIAFLSGRQARISPWTETLMLAWLARCLSEPRKFIPRYFKALRLVFVIFKYADQPTVSSTLSP